jgi:hypothetical protein
MHRFYVPTMLTGLLCLNTALLAEAPKKSDANLGTVAFERGWHYDQGLGVRINMTEAIHSYREAADRRSPLAKGCPQRSAVKTPPTHADRDGDRVMLGSEFGEFKFGDALNCLLKQLRASPISFWHDRPRSAH